METVWWHWMWMHMNDIWKNDNSVMALLKMWMKNRMLWEQCDGTECEYIWVMKWSDENSVMALNVNAYE